MEFVSNHASPASFAQVVKCFIELFSLHPIGVYHHSLVGCNTVREPTGNFLIASNLNAHVEQSLLVGQVDEVMHDLPPQPLCLAGQKEDLLCQLLGQPCHGNSCIQLHSHGRPTTGDKLIHTCGSYNPHQQHKHLYFTAPTVCRGKRPPTHIE